jgi:hypothetical protein
LAGVVYSIIWRTAPFVSGDTPGYVEVATDLQDGKLDELHDRTPGYSFLLLATNSLEPSPILFITQLSLYLLSVFLLVFFLNDLGISKQFILLFLLLSLIPPSVVNTVYMLTETFTTFFLVVGTVTLFWWFKNGKTLAIILSGVAFALSALVRPTYQFLFIMLSRVFLIFLLFLHTERKKIIFATISIFLSSCIVLGGFSLYNHQHFNYFGLSPMLGFNLSTKTVRVIERLPDEYKGVRDLLINSRNSDLIANNSSHTGVMFIWQTIPDLQRLTGLNKVDLSNYMLKLNLLLIRQAPLEYIVEITKSLSTYWLPSSTDISNFNSRTIQLLWITVHFAVITVFFAVTLLIFSLFVFTWRFPIEIKSQISNLIKPFHHLFLPFFIAISIIIYTMLISTMIEVGNPRYRTPTDLLIFFALTIGVYFITQLGSQSKSGG